MTSPTVGGTHPAFTFFFDLTPFQAAPKNKFFIPSYFLGVISRIPGAIFAAIVAGLYFINLKSGISAHLALFHCFASLS
jgi:hypothetical protein